MKLLNWLKGLFVREPERVPDKVIELREGDDPMAICARECLASGGQSVHGYVVDGKLHLEFWGRD